MSRVQEIAISVVLASWVALFGVALGYSLTESLAEFLFRALQAL